jgi:hypothetical protein
VGDAEAGVGVRRGQVLAAVLVAAIAVGGAVYVDREVGPRVPDAGSRTTTASGEWFCPHGGGAEWEVELEVANPGTEPATIRVRTLGERRPSEPTTATVEPGSLLRVPVTGDARERASTVEWFDQWVAVGWVAHAGGDEGGVAAEPCAPAAGARWLVPDGTSAEEENRDHVVVMNPFSRDAVVSIAFLSDRSVPVRHSELTDVVLRSHRSLVVPMSDYVARERTVSALVVASVGRVAAGSLGVVETGGIRSAVGYLGQPPSQLVFPGGDDAGRAELVVMSTATERTSLAGELLDAEVAQPFAGLADSAPPAESGRTYQATTAGPASVLFTSEGSGIAAARRTYGVASDQASTGGAAPAAAWVILPTVDASPSHPGLVLANPAREPAEVTLRYLAPATAEPIRLTIPPMRTVTAPRGFVEAAPAGAVVATASGGTFVPASASYSHGREGFATYAVALGIPVPSGWIPA